MNAAESLPTTLDRTDQRWAVALEAAGDGVWDWCVPQNQVFCSRRWKEMLGYGEDELGDSFEEWESRIHRDDLPDYYRRLKRHIDGEMPVFSSEHRMRCRDGSYRWFLDRGMVISRGDNGQPVRVIGTHSDITESRLAKDALKSSQQKLRTIIDIALDAVVQMDAAGIITDWNIQAEKVFGWSKQEAIGRLLHETIIPTQYREAHVAGLAQCLATGQGALLNTRVETLALHRRGHTFPVELAISPLLIDGKYEFSSFIRDITDRKQAEAAIKLSDSVYKAIGEAIMIADTSNRIVAVNPVFTEVTGYSEEEVIGQSPSLLKSGRHDQTYYQMMWTSLEKTGHWKGEIWNRRKNGEIYPEWLSIHTIYDADGEAQQRIALFSDITEQKKIEETIQRQANFDPLTGLPNRRLFHDRLQLELKKMQRANQLLALLFIDLDHFKEVNDTLGHDVGDSLLIEAAQRIGRCVRDSDTVARLGGDEFTVIMSGLNDGARIEEVAQSVIDALARPFRLANETAYISASVGITVYPHDATEITSLLKNADQAMYFSKGLGRNCFSYFTSSMQETAQTRMRLANDLREALSGRQLLVYYQPIVELASGAIHKAEALLRWRHPARGLVGPGDFIHIAEETGLIVDIGNWVFRQAAAQALRWRTAHHPAFQVSVNLSPAQFRGKAGARAPWIDNLRKLGLPGEGIVAEITEGLLLEASTAVFNQLLEFRDAKIQVALDDFGTGYSSLSYLQKFDIDYIKIDRSFVRNLKPAAHDLVLCEAMIVMAHKLGMKVIAEGVETEIQRDLLAAAGCDFGQGYLFSRPVPAGEFERLLSDSLTPPGPSAT